MYEIENHISESIEIVLSNDLEDCFLADAINAQVKLKAGVLASDYWSLDLEAPLH